MSETVASASPPSAIDPNSAAMRHIPFEGEVKADAPRRTPPAIAPSPESSPVAATPVVAAELSDLRDFIRSRRAALAGFMEQGASLKLDGDLLTVAPRSDIYVRYLGDNRNVIAELASELYGRRIRVEMAANGAIATASPGLSESRGAAGSTSGNSESRSAPQAPSVEPPTNGSSSAPASSGSPVRAVQPDARQRLYADPLVQRIFEEFDARLVEIKTTSVPTDVPAPIGGRK
jgi:hypothetical protein